MNDKVWDKYLKKLGDSWEIFRSGNDWKVLVSDCEDPILCEKFAGYLGSSDRIERIAHFDHGWVVTKPNARVGPSAMRALLDAWE